MIPRGMPSSTGGPQHGVSPWLAVKGSHVHSQTLPVMS
jgi:hypothetical protein